MITILEYQCEICRQRYPTVEQALYCERTGRFDPTQFKVGIMWEYNHNGYVGVFALPKDGAQEYEQYGHLGTIVSWACRAAGHIGDTLGDNRCGDGSLLRSDPASMKKFYAYHNLTKDHVGGPEFKRMVNWLKSQNIVPSYYNELGELITVKA